MNKRNTQYSIPNAQYAQRIVYLCVLILTCLFLPQLAQAANITLHSPSGSVWTESKDVKFDVEVSDTEPAYAFINWQDSLVGWWRGEGNADDESGNSNNGTLVGNTTYATGKFGQAFNFGGSGDYIDLGDKDEFDFHKTDSFTISVWVNKDDESPSVIIHKGAYFRLFYTETKAWFFNLGNPRKYVFYVEPNPQGKWVHIVVVYNAVNENLSMYFDDEHKNSNPSQDFGDFSSADLLKIGGGFWENYDHNGLIDEVMIFNRALTAEEIKALYNATAQHLVTTFNGLDELKAYNYEVYAVNASGNKTSISGSISVDTPNSAPLVSLEAPLSPTHSSSTTQQFKVQALNTNADTTLASATLYIDYGTGLLPQETMSLSGTIDTAVFTKEGLKEGTLSWNCSVSDSKGNAAFAKANSTLIIGQPDYYVAPYGDDTNPGTIGLPFKTIQKFADIALPGDTCYIRQGTYRETVTPVSSGNALAPITYKAYPGETVTISGADPLTGGWTQHQGSIYKTTMNWDLGLGNNQIFFDGKVMMEARWPDADDVMKPNLLDIDSGTFVNNGSSGGSTATINDSNLIQPAGFWNGAVVHAIWQPRYHAITGQVRSYSSGTLEIDLHSQPYGNINTLGIYYITCSYNALDKESEWFYDNTTSTLYLWAPGSSNPSTHTVEAKKRDLAFDLKGKSYINIEGLDIFASTITTDIDSHHITIDSIDAHYVSHYTLIDEGNMGSGTKGIRDTGIILDGHNNVIQNSEIAYSAGNGVSLIGNDNTVHNCDIHNVNYVVTECAVINTGGRKAQNNKITHNKLYNAGRCIIVHTNAQNLKILHNEMYGSRYGTETYDLGVTYAIATDGKGTEFAYNYIHDYISEGIYLDSYNYNFIVHHNVIEKSPSAYPFIGLFFNTQAVNNQAYHNTILSSLIVRADIPASNVIIKNNIVGQFRYTFGSSPTPTPEEVDYTNNIELNSTDPHIVFVDFDNKDFYLNPGSPAIDAGQDLGFTEDYDGNSIPQGAAPDIGAYEYMPKTGTMLYGDVSGDGEVSAYDAALTAQASVDLITLTADQTKAADVNGDSEVSAYDAALIAQRAVGLIEKFPVEEG